ncbi:MAG: hypothetical protein IT310_09475 [Anaerolineales bacterium]|nr:hypothetical protein [Anaerolineales bacterium]
MKKIIRTIVFIFCMAFTNACSPSNIAVLEANGEKVKIEFWQNDSRVPFSSDQEPWSVTLKPEPFTLMVHGEKDSISIMALKSSNLLKPLQNLQKLQRPLIHPQATSQGFYKNDLYLQEQPLEVLELNSSIYKAFGLSFQELTDDANSLTTQLNAKPSVLTTMRTYLGDHSSFIIETINQGSIKDYESIILVVFADQPLEQTSQKIEWDMLKWLIFKVEFISN